MFDDIAKALGGGGGGGGQKNAEVTRSVYFDIAINGVPKGRIEMGLFGSEVGVASTPSLEQVAPR